MRIGKRLSALERRVQATPEPLVIIRTYIDPDMTGGPREAMVRKAGEEWQCLFRETGEDDATFGARVDAMAAKLAHVD